MMIFHHHFGTVENIQKNCNQWTKRTYRKWFPVLLWSVGKKRLEQLCNFPRVILWGRWIVISFKYYIHVDKKSVHLLLGCSGIFFICVKFYISLQSSVKVWFDIFLKWDWLFLIPGQRKTAVRFVSIEKDFRLNQSEIYCHRQWQQEPDKWIYEVKRGKKVDFEFNVKPFTTFDRKAKIWLSFDH